MQRIIIVSNRLPVTIKENKEEYTIQASAGGLATGLKSFHKNGNSTWIGWSGIISNDKKEQNKISNLLEKENCSPIFLDKNLIKKYYDGYSNGTLWPLFHYFTEFTEFKNSYWESYYEVNKIFTETIISQAQKNDTVWIHDYQLMLVPNMLREKRPDLKIGFFLHIPFPSYEVFRILPKRNDIIKGLLGCDLIGFHTYDYARHFISSVKRLLGYDVEFNTISTESRKVYVDVFPMGIDYKKFNDTSLKVSHKSVRERSEIQQQIDKFFMQDPERKLMLSIDRLDYTKGIPQRLKAFRFFIKNHPEYKEKVSLIMLTVPSRVDVEQYQNLKKEVDELVGQINGEFGTISWNPIIYFYRSLPFDNLIELYSSSDIALLTPLRDGMNLVAKEFIASKINKKGVLILSEMAGASKELGQATTVNPYSLRSVSNAIVKALNMDEQKQEEDIITMQDRISRYDVFRWANDFVSALNIIAKKQEEHLAGKINDVTKQELIANYKKSSKSILFLDYDGTLQRFFKVPQNAKPDEELLDLLKKLNEPENTEIVIISGRDKQTLGDWLGNQGYTLIAEHGAWIKPRNENWIEKAHSNTDWKKNIKPILESYVDRTPGSLIEDKTHSLTWHYRKADIELGNLRARELRTDVANLIANQKLEILEGSKVIEIKVSGINKGYAALEYLKNNSYDFILAIGDDWTDEYTFKELPNDSITIKVGTDKSHAKYYINDYIQVRELLKNLTL
ncbi:MAG: bifunctional alpha,alpha-trehalose-phosphate synthase (UDP-forming)/trehalose-phosphatase [Flavobacteriales bacterium]|nr:bifunctional alpha,alpha-trehalose-phosphate synthase (UDP-forming)/trehalose-phosphatase [Flavobacteriales bacterium]